MDEIREPQDNHAYRQRYGVPSGNDECPPPDALAHLMLPQAGVSLSGSPMATAATWADEQLVCGIPLDLRTPSLDDQTTAATDWNVALAQIAASASATPELAAPTHSTPAIPLCDVPMSLSPPQILMGNSTAFPVTSRLRTQHAKRTLSDWSQPQPQSSVADGQGVHGSRSVQSAVNTSALREPLSDCPTSRGGTRPPTASKRNHDPHDERADSVSDGGSQEDEKLKISRERNRIAAAKTRRKKKRSAKEIEERAREIEQTNTLLHQEVRVLRDEFSSLRYCALSHDPTVGCTCTPIHRYNEHMAKEVAKEVAKGI
ncbi:hypothetical protein BST61_g2550 [Cercospora zeina]